MEMQRYDRISFENEELPIRINFAKPFSEKDLKREKYSWHEQIELLYFKNGSATVFCDNREIKAQKGDTVLINPCQVHRVEPCIDTLYDCFMIDKRLYLDFEPAGWGKYFKPFDDGHLQFENLIRDPKLNFCLEELCEEMKNAAVGFELAVKAGVLKLFAILFRGYVVGESSLLSENNERYSRIKPAMELMKKRMSEKISLKELASSCNVSEAHFCRMFKELCGRSPMQYLLELRLGRVAKLLKTTEKSVSEIAWESGFDDVSYLCRRFREKYGVTPSKLRGKTRT